MSTLRDAVRAAFAGRFPNAPTSKLNHAVERTLARPVFTCITADVLAKPENADELAGIVDNSFRENAFDLDPLPDAATALALEESLIGKPYTGAAKLARLRELAADENLRIKVEADAKAKGTYGGVKIVAKPTSESITERSRKLADEVAAATGIESAIRKRALADSIAGDLKTEAATVSLRSGLEHAVSLGKATPRDRLTLHRLKSASGAR